MPPLLRVERRDTDQPMDAGFRSQVTECIVPVHTERDRFYSRLFTFLIIERLRLETVLLGPSKIHSHQHFRPVLRFRTAGSGMDIHDRVELIIFAGEKNLGLDLIDKRFVLVQTRRELIADIFAFLGKFDERFQIFQLSGYFFAEIESFLEAGAFAQDLAGALLVGIKVGLSDLFLNFIELVLLGLDVKETSALPRFVF